jgi:hypothetical protein
MTIAQRMNNKYTRHTARDTKLNKHEIEIQNSRRQPCAAGLTKDATSECDHGNY